MFVSIVTIILVLVGSWFFLCPIITSQLNTAKHKSLFQLAQLDTNSLQYKQLFEFARTRNGAKSDAIVYHPVYGKDDHLHLYKLSKDSIVHEKDFGIPPKNSTLRTNITPTSDLLLSQFMTIVKDCDQITDLLDTFQLEGMQTVITSGSTVHYTLRDKSFEIKLPNNLYASLNDDGTVKISKLSPCANPDTVLYGDYISFYEKNYLGLEVSVPDKNSADYNRVIKNFKWECSSINDQNPTLVSVVDPSAIDENRSSIGTKPKLKPDNRTYKHVTDHIYEQHINGKYEKVYCENGVFWNIVDRVPRCCDKQCALGLPWYDNPKSTIFIYKFHDYTECDLTPLPDTYQENLLKWIEFALGRSLGEITDIIISGSPSFVDKPGFLDEPRFLFNLNDRKVPPDVIDVGYCVRSFWYTIREPNYKQQNSVYCTYTLLPLRCYCSLQTLTPFTFLLWDKKNQHYYCELSMTIGVLSRLFLVWASEGLSNWQNEKFPLQIKELDPTIEQQLISVLEKYVTNPVLRLVLPSSDIIPIVNNSLSNEVLIGDANDGKVFALRKIDPTDIITTIIDLQDVDQQLVWTKRRPQNFYKEKTNRLKWEISVVTVDNEHI